MSEAELVDLGADPVARQRASRRRLRRVVAPLATAALLIASVIALVIVGAANNRRGALELSDEVLEGLEQRIMLRTADWLGSAQRALELLHIVYVAGPLAQATREDAKRLAIALLHNVPALAIVSLADTRGNYVMQRRNEAGGVDTKEIREDPPPRRVTWIRRGRDGRVTGTEDDPTDSFDPRTRPWFAEAIAAEGVVWTEPYIFFTDRVPGVTASIAFRAGDAVRGVLGVDIRLDALGAFLGSLEIGKSGRAIIVDRDGRIVAHPDKAATMREVDGTLIRPRLDELGDPVLTRAYDLFRISGPDRYTYRIKGTEQIAIWAPMHGVGDGSWSLLITAPESDFIGFVGTNSRIAAAGSLAVIVIALGLALLLVRQGLRADAMERTIERRTEIMVAQARTLARLGSTPAVHDPTRDEGMGLLSAALVDTLGARRAGIWRIGSAGDSLRCEDVYDAASASHAQDLRLKRDDHPQFFAALARGETFEVDDAAADPRTRELGASLLSGTGTKSLLCVPALRGATLIGAILVGDRDRRQISLAQADTFSVAIAGIAVARLMAAEGVRRAARAPAASEAGRAVAGVAHPAPASPPPPSLPPSHLPPSHLLGDGMLTARPAIPTAARKGGMDGTAPAAEIFPSVTVMVLRLPDTVALAEPVAAAGGCAVADRVVQLLQERAAEREIAYLRVLGGQVIAADGFGDRAAAATEAIASLAIEAAERCAELFASLDLPSAHRIGIATGTVAGSDVGKGVRTYNIWGEAVRAAEALAATAPRGTVQVSEAVQARIAGHFAFRPRGRFWAPGAGEVATFLLVGAA